MPAKSLNFTNRAKIDRQKIDLRLAQSGNTIKVLGHVDLSDITLPKQFSVVVEIYRQTYRERVHATTVVPTRAEVNGEFEAFAAIETLLCVVKVLSEEPDVGKILAWAEGIRPSLEGAASGSESLLPTESADLGQLIWRLDVSEDLPILQINSAIESWREFAREPRFQWLVMPEVLRGIGWWLSPRLDDAESGSDPTAREWLDFIRSLGVEPTDFEGSETERPWIDQAVSEFTAKNGFVDKLLDEMSEGADL